VIQVERGAALQDVLFPQGVEFPCGGRGRCKGCKIKVLGRSLPVTPEDQSRLSTSELGAGWRLACRARAEADLRIELAQWEAAILSDDSTFAFDPREGLGVAIDLGTTTVVAQLLDLQTGRVLAVRSALNAQAKHGADIMSRVEFAVSSQGQPALQKLIREQIGELVGELLAAAGVAAGGESRLEARTAKSQRHSPLESIVLVGNTVMHHLFSGISVEPLSQYPFEPSAPGLQVFAADVLGWDLPGNPKVYFLPCFGGFVGSDILAGVLATRLHERESLTMLIDLGTNGEIILGNRERLLCAATAAGPAFEGAGISMGMRAATGAISEVHVVERPIALPCAGKCERSRHLRERPRGRSGSQSRSGLDSAKRPPRQRRETRARSSGLAQSMGHRQLQLAKGAIAAGARILLEQWGATDSDLTQVFLAGAFGNYINQANARRIGLLEFPLENIVSAGNTALLGAKLALFNLAQESIAYPGILARTTHISLNEAPGFQDIYVEKMAFS
jgi:uncharacterized 2Fe-2S/4Fe-4S cluster protein (DUF4445 family)